MSDTEDRWYVNVGSEDVRMMTLDELVDAFEQGVITRDTLVVEVGGNEWQPLKDVADLGDEDPVPAAAPVRAAEKPAPQTSWPPQAVARESAWPPATTMPSSIAPVAASVRPMSAPLSGAPNSTIPVVQDLDLDLPAQSFKSGRKGLVAAALVAVVAVGGIGFAASRGGAPATSPVPVPAAAPVATVDTTPYTEREVTPAPAAEPVKEEGERLTEEQKKALLSADKDRESKKRVRGAAAPRSGGRAAPQKSGAVFKATGNADDPLNPTL